MAYRCQLHELSMCCAVEAARKLTHCSRLSNGPGKLSSTYPAAALAAERCDKGMLVQLVWLLAHTAMPGFFPDPEAAAAALQKATQPSFEWSLEDFSQWVDLGIDVGESVRSPWFWAAGKRWRFKVYPSADEYEAHGHLSGAVALVMRRLWCSSRLPHSPTTRHPSTPPTQPLQCT